MQLAIGQIVCSRAGRDTTRFYMVAALAKERVLLTDGLKWPLNAPKAKNPRHINPTQTILPPNIAGDDASIRKALAAYTAQHGLVNKGG